MRWAFVDYENVGSLEDISLEQYERIYVFCGPKNSKLKLGELPAEGFCRIELIGLKTSGRNNLDFHLTFYLGRYHEAAEKLVAFHVISNDTGFDGVVDHLRKLGREAQRVGTRHTKPKAEGRAEPKASPAKPARQPRARAGTKPKAELKQDAALVSSAEQQPVAKPELKSAPKAEPRAARPRGEGRAQSRGEPKASARAGAKTEPAPPAPREPGAPLSDAARLLVTQLKQTGDTQRPAKKGKLLNWMQNRLQGPHAGVAPDTVLQELIASAQLSLSGANVKYLF